MTADKIRDAAQMLLEAHDSIAPLREMSSGWDQLRAALAEPTTALPPKDATKPNRQQGLYGKFRVERTDGTDAPGGKHDGCDYFVLDATHDKHASAALTAYASSVSATHPQLAADMRSRWGLAEPDQAASAREPVTKEWITRMAALEDAAGTAATIGAGSHLAAPAADAVPVVVCVWDPVAGGNIPCVLQSSHLAAMEALRADLGRLYGVLADELRQSRDENERLKAGRSAQVEEVMHAVDEFSVAAGMSAIGVSEGVVRGSPDHAILERRFTNTRTAVESAVRKLAGCA